MDSDVEVAPQEHVTFDYTNHRGEHNQRRVAPLRIYFGTSQWHHKQQWLFSAYDLDKKAPRTFAMDDMTNWKGAESA